MQIKAVLFDMDGLMIDSERLADTVWRNAACDAGTSITKQDMTLLRGVTQQEARKRFMHIHPAFPFDLVEENAHNELTRQLAQHVPLKHGLLELLQFLKEHQIKMAVASSSNQSLVEQNLRTANVRNFFDAVVCGDMITHSKPAPDIFLRAAAELNTPPTQCMVLEDSENGIKAGLAAGCYTVWIPDLDPIGQELQENVTTLDNLKDVIALWDTL